MTSRRVDLSHGQVLDPGPGLHVSGSCPASSNATQEAQAKGRRRRLWDPLAMVRLVGRGLGKGGRTLCSCPRVLANAPGAPRSSGSPGRGDGFPTNRGKGPNEREIVGPVPGEPKSPHSLHSPPWVSQPKDPPLPQSQPHSTGGQQKGVQKL